MICIEQLVSCRWHMIVTNSVVLSAVVRFLVDQLTMQHRSHRRQLPSAATMQSLVAVCTSESRSIDQLPQLRFPTKQLAQLGYSVVRVAKEQNIPAHEHIHVKMTRCRLAATLVRMCPSYPSSLAPAMSAPVVLGSRLEQKPSL
jgi:hypothetical protein